MQPLHGVNFDDAICTWRRVKNDVMLYHNVIFIIVKVWKSYFQHQKVLFFITSFAAKKKKQQFKNDMLTLH